DMRRISMDKDRKARRMIIGWRGECYASGLPSAGDQFTIERGVLINHFLDGEFGEDALVAGLAHLPSLRLVVEQPMRTAGELEAIAERNEVPGDAIHHQIAIAGNICGNHGYTGGHRLENCVRLPLIFASQPKHIEMLHEPRHVIALAQEMN